MSRILKGYRWRFERLLRAFGAQNVSKGVDILLGRAKELAQSEELPINQALAQVNMELVQKLAKYRRLCRGLLNRKEKPKVLLCDAGLGALARWLRACGQRALWRPGVDDSELVSYAAQTGAVLITSDSMLSERRVVRMGKVQLIWVPPDMPVLNQLTCVLVELDLRPQQARCMSCGGELVRVDKNSVKNRIPPKTWVWRDEYFICTSCHKLYWEGSHWEKITRKLEAIGVTPKLMTEG